MKDEFDEFFNDSDAADEEAAIQTLRKRGRPRKSSNVELPALDMTSGSGELPDLEELELPDIGLDVLSSGDLPKVVLVDSYDDGNHLLEPLPDLPKENVQRITDASGDFSSDYATSIVDADDSVSYDNEEDEDEEQDIDSILAAMVGGDSTEESDEDSYFNVYEQGELDVLHNFNIDEILGDAIDMGASDVHLSADDLVSFSILGEIHRLDIYSELTGTMTQRLQQSILSNVLEDIFINELELDTSYVLKTGKHRGRRTRLSVGKSKGDIFMVFRIVADVMPRPHELGVSGELLEWINLPNGLVMMNGPTGTGKALKLDTPIPTPSGFTTMGELEVGSVIYDRFMKPCRVTWLSPVDENPVLYKVVLSDGQELYADANHRWIVAAHGQRNGNNKPRALKQKARRERATVISSEMLLEANSNQLQDVITVDELYELFSSRGWIEEFKTPRAIYMALRAASCPHVVGQGTLVNIYPTVLALTALSEHVKNKFSARGQLSVLTTEELIAEGLERNGRSNFAIPLVVEGFSEDKSLPIDPYLFGVWLGDGSSDRGTIASGYEDVDEMHKFISASWSGTVERVDSPGAAALKLINNEDEEPFRKTLRSLGVYCNKHIPQIFLNSSRDQRLALLQGLLDSDGSVDKRSGIATFGGVNERLVKDVALLIRSLGFRTTIRKKKAGITLSDGSRKDCGFAWYLSFTTDEKVFRLNRKKKYLPASVSPMQKWNYITAIEEVKTDDVAYGPVRCITVDSEDHSFLCGEYVVTHNSTTLASMLQEIQFTRPQKIITLEKPIEFVYGNKGRALITQREIGKDAREFTHALTSAMRQAPDIIMVGEVRNRLEVNELLRAAETGHLAISTMHTNSAAATINRIKSLYEGDDQLRILASLSDVARGFANQVLLKTIDGKGRFAVREVLSVNEEIAAHIQNGDVKAIRDYQVENGITMEHALVEAVVSGRCSREDALAQSAYPRLFNKLLAAEG